MGALFRGLVLAAPFVVAGIDVVRQRQWSLLPAALLDESAHVVTALLAHGALRLPVTSDALVGTIAGATLLDADHVPHHLGWRLLTRDTERPLTHSLASVIVVAVAALVAPARWRQLIACAAFGAATQLVRDTGTGSVPLWWPANRSEVRMPYALYAAFLLACAAALGAPWQRRAAT